MPACTYLISISAILFIRCRGKVLFGILYYECASFDLAHDLVIVTVARCQGDKALGAVDDGLDAGRLTREAIVDVLG